MNNSIMPKAWFKSRKADPTGFLRQDNRICRIYFFIRFHPVSSGRKQTTKYTKHTKGRSAVFLDGITGSEGFTFSSNPTPYIRSNILSLRLGAKNHFRWSLLASRTSPIINRLPFHFVPLLSQAPASLRVAHGREDQPPGGASKPIILDRNSSIGYKHGFY